MSFVKDEITYDQIQRSIRKITKQAKVPAIYLDVLAWNMTQPARIGHSGFDEMKIKNSRDYLHDSMI